VTTPADELRHALTRAAAVCAEAADISRVRIFTITSALDFQPGDVVIGYRPPSARPSSDIGSRILVARPRPETTP
jgi:hypothetical protein